MAVDARVNQVASTETGELCVHVEVVRSCSRRGREGRPVKLTSEEEDGWKRKRN